jgi:esterase/lipase
MSDIQEEQKRLYKRAEENDKRFYVELSQQDVQDIINAYEKDIKKLNKLQNRIDKAIEYIKEQTKQINFENDKLVDILDILKGKE